MSEEVDAKEIADLCNVHKRTILNWAAKGMLPGAKKLHGVWRFDINKVRRWMFENEARACQFISEEKPGGYELPSTVLNTAAQLRQQLGLKP